MNLGKKIGLALLLVFIGIQFFQPAKNVSAGDHLGPFLLETNPPEAVVGLMNTSCFDCHSNQTRYPWYSRVAPVSYWIADHIDHGKGHLNFSAWGEYDRDKKVHKLEEVVETVKSGEMPLRSYTWGHADARLTDSQRRAILDWAQTTRSIYSLNDRPE